MIRTELARLFSGRLGGMLASIAGPKLLLIVSALLFGTWVWGQFGHSRAETKQAENQVLTIERDQYKAINQRLNKAVALIEKYAKDRSVRDTASAERQQRVNADESPVLDMPLPESVLRVLREPITFTAPNPFAAPVGTEPADG